jgi:hypothetical protein
MRILVAHNFKIHNKKAVENYALSMIRDLRFRGHEVFETVKTPPARNSTIYNGMDLLLDIDCGRDSNGNLHWHSLEKKPKVKSAVYLIDSHGYPSLHHRIAKRYDHVFFCVWDKRDLFAGHPSAHWCPNFTDHAWFDGDAYACTKPTFDFGFFGSKGGLSRAKPLSEIALSKGWSADVRQINIGERHRWPATAEEMAKCRFLFNHGQKHDGPNLRVFESMCMLRPLITDQDPRSGMDKLFAAGTHYIPYEAYTYEGLEFAMTWCMSEPKEAKKIAKTAYDEIKAKHLVRNRMDQILEVVNGA